MASFRSYASNLLLRLSWAPSSSKALRLEFSTFDRSYSYRLSCWPTGMAAARPEGSCALFGLTEMDVDKERIEQRIG